MLFKDEYGASCSLYEYYDYELQFETNDDDYDDE
jgi:hypothetical protein